MERLRQQKKAPAQLNSGAPENAVAVPWLLRLAIIFLA